MNGASVEQIFLFVNPKSGGNKGEVFLKAPQPFVVDVGGGRQVNLNIFSLLVGESGKKPGFLKLKEVCQSSGRPVRCIVGGGDGTVMWADTEAAKVGIDTQKQIWFGIVPLGTGNDFSRVAGWGGNNPQNVEAHGFERLKRLVRSWSLAMPRPHDVWQVTLTVRPTVGKIMNIGDSKVEEDIGVASKTFSMINYFSIGQESKVGIHFDKHRTKSQTCNLFVYAGAGLGQELSCWNRQDISHIVSNLIQGTDHSGFVILDSESDKGEPELQGSPESLMFLNIDSYAGGNAHFWQLDTESGVEPPHESKWIDVKQDPGDGRLEVVTLPNISDIPLDKLSHNAKRVFSGGPYFIEYWQKEDSNDSDVHAYCEVDGEFYHMVNPDSTLLKLQKKLQVLQHVGEDDPDSSDDEDNVNYTC